MLTRKLRKSDFNTERGPMWGEGLVSNGHWLVRTSALDGADPLKYAASAEALSALAGQVTRTLPASASGMLSASASRPAVRTPWHYLTRTPRTKRGKADGFDEQLLAIYSLTDSGGLCTAVSAAYADLLFGQEPVMTSPDGVTLYSLEGDIMCMGVMLRSWEAWQWPALPTEVL